MSSSLTTSDSSPDLLKQTLRTVAVLVTACVVFVGALSAAAVAITSRAFASPSSSASVTDLAKPDVEPIREAGGRNKNVVPAKKPQSI
jgi:hypothetical protein